MVFIFNFSCLFTYFFNQQFKVFLACVHYISLASLDDIDISMYFDMSFFAVIVKIGSKLRFH